MLKDKLQIILITYNRRKYLARTFEQIFAENSPVRDFDITVLDNCSTDGTRELIEKYCKKFPNLQNIRHKRNIGGNANICRALEIASKEYVWVLCDDDSYDWHNWPEMEQAVLSDLYDAVMVRTTDLYGTREKAKIFRQCTFLPSAIYKTKNIVEGLCANAYGNISNIFPHLALVAHIININGNFYLPKEDIIKKATADITDFDILKKKGYDCYIPEIVQNMYWAVGYINSTTLIRDKKIRAYIVNNTGNHGFCSFIYAFFRHNIKRYNNSLYNICTVFCSLNFSQRIKFVFIVILLNIVYFPYRLKKSIGINKSSGTKF